MFSSSFAVLVIRGADACAYHLCCIYCFFIQSFSFHKHISAAFVNDINRIQWNSFFFSLFLWLFYEIFDNRKASAKWTAEKKNRMSPYTHADTLAYVRQFVPSFVCVCVCTAHASRTRNCFFFSSVASLFRCWLDYDTIFFTSHPIARLACWPHRIVQLPLDPSWFVDKLPTAAAVCVRERAIQAHTHRHKERMRSSWSSTSNAHTRCSKIYGNLFRNIYKHL